MSTATTTASTVWRPMLSSTYQTVTLKAFQNTGSATIRW